MIAYIEKREKQIIEVQQIINYMISYPKLADKIGLSKTLNYKDLCKKYSGWLYMLKRFENKSEIEFFKEHWLQINDVYIDLSDKNYPMFYTEFIGFEDCVWAVNLITPNLHNFIKELDNPSFSIEKHFNSVTENIITMTEEFLK